MSNNSVVGPLLQSPSAPGAQPAPVGAAPNEAPGAALPDPSSLSFIKDLATGAIPGVFVPHGADLPPEVMSIQPKQLLQMGIDMYRPHEEGISVAIFNPKAISADELAQADKAGKLTNVLAPITKYFGAGAQQQVASPQDSATGAPPSAAGPQASPDANSAPTSTPVMPRPTFSAEAQKMAAQLRMQNPAGVEPSKRPLPGQGAVINGLMPKPI